MKYSHVIGLAGLLFVAIVLLPASGGGLASAGRRPKRRDENERPTYDAKDEQLEQLPDYGDPKVMKALRCSSCNALIKEVYVRLMALNKRKDGKYRMYEIVDVLEDTCPTLRDEYGLLLKNNKPTTVFSRNKAITRMSGSWINSFIDTRCGELLSTYEEDLIKHYKLVKDLEELRELVCVKWEKTCAINEIHDEF
jgi:hypothetical protein